MLLTRLLSFCMALHESIILVEHPIYVTAEGQVLRVVVELPGVTGCWAMPSISYSPGISIRYQAKGGNKRFGAKLSLTCNDTSFVLWVIHSLGEFVRATSSVLNQEE